MVRLAGCVFCTVNQNIAHHVRTDHSPTDVPCIRPCLQTTLLNHILKADHGKRIAVIENEVCGFHTCHVLTALTSCRAFLMLPCRLKLRKEP